MRRIMTVAAAALTVIGGAAWIGTHADGYETEIVMPSATGLVEGSKVLIDGFDAGAITDIAAVDGKAVVGVEVNDEFAPLHSGAKAQVVWKAVLGERQIAIQDGSPSNPEIPEEGMLKGQVPDPVEIDTVLNALDGKTRRHLRSLIDRMNETSQGNEKALQSTLQTSGPAIAALGSVLRGLGSDGRAITSLVQQTNHMIGTLAQRDEHVAGMVQQLSGLASRTADRREALKAGFARLPDVLSGANRTLAKVPRTADKAIPLLHDTRGVTERLPSVAEKLRPVLRDLRPTVAQLRPTLRATDTLLQFTPGLLDSMNAVLPASTRAVRGYAPALRFLRPYTPEMVGWLSNWASSAANYDSHGHYMRIFVPGSGSSFNHNPGVMPPGMTHDPYPWPGELVGQPWTDAHGSRPQ